MPFDPARKTEAYDNALLGILQHETKLENFLDVMFGFLCRRTDFFRTLKSPTQTYGFPPGVAEKMISYYFKKYQSAVLEAEKREEMKQEQKVDDTVKEATKPALPQANSTQDDDQSAATSATNTASTEKHVPKANPKDDAATENKETKLDQTTFQSNPDSYNGAIRDKYTWSQNYDDVDIKVPVPADICRGKQVYVSIQRKRLEVKTKSSSASNFEVIIADELQHEVKVEESMWSLEGGKSIQITLTKEKGFWWTMLVLGEEEIDIQKIKPERPMEDMGEEEQAVIQKLQFDEHQKRMGLPQSHELKVHEMLKKGWDAEGSPFKGQDFDPKMFNVSPSAVSM